MKILGFFIRHPSFSDLYSFSSPGDLSCEPFGILFFCLSLSLFTFSPDSYSSLLSIKKINLCFLSQPHFTAIIKTLMQSTLLSLSPSCLLFPGPAADSRRATSNRIPTLSNGAITTLAKPLCVHF